MSNRQFVVLVALLLVFCFIVMTHGNSRAMTLSPDGMRVGRFQPYRHLHDGEGRTAVIDTMTGHVWVNPPGQAHWVKLEWLR